MPAGLQVWDAAGNLVLDLPTSITRIMGKVTLGAGSGSVNVGNGRPWFAILEENSFGLQECAYQFNISGTTISWSLYPSEPLSPAPPPPTIVYGAY